MCSLLSVMSRHWFIARRTLRKIVISTFSAEHVQSKETSRLRVRSSVSTTAPFSTHDVTLGDVDGSLFHIKVWFFMGHHDQYGQNWGNISQLAMWLSQNSANIYKTDQSTYQFQHLAARFDSAMNKWTLPHLSGASFFYRTHRPNK